MQTESVLDRTAVLARLDAAIAHCEQTGLLCSILYGKVENQRLDLVALRAQLGDPKPANPPAPAGEITAGMLA
jgi:hypothetical protein